MSFFGLVSFQPRLAIVLFILTLTVVVVGIQILRDSGIRRVDTLFRVAQRAFAVPEKKKANPRDPEEVEALVREWTGARIVLPRDEELFTYTGVAREKVGRQVTAVIRLSFSGERYLLLVVRREMIGRAGSPDFLFSQTGFFSGEKDGMAYVFWEREGVSYLVVTGSDLEHAFDLVRRYFT
ncbi:MAG: hypothetical protein WBX49_08550 [Candidatus Deferrimicrobiaceae bacterium]